MAYSFDFTNSIINITSPQTEVTCQELINEIRDEEDEILNLSFNKIADATGKQSLGGDVGVGITVELLDNWQIKFWAGNYIAKISGGNLVGGLGGDPIAYSAGVQVLLIQSAASTVVTTGDGPLTSTQNAQLMGTALEVTAQAIKNNTDTIDWTNIETIILQNGEIEEIRKMISNKVTKSGNIITIFEDNETTIWRQYDLSLGGRVFV